MDNSLLNQWHIIEVLTATSNFDLNCVFSTMRMQKVTYFLTFQSLFNLTKCIQPPSSKLDRITSNEDQNDQRPILHVSSNAIHQRNCFVLWYLSVCLSVCLSVTYLTYLSFTLY